MVADFLAVASLAQIQPGTSLVVKVADKDIALFNVDGQIYAIDDACVHQGASLGSGKFEGKIVTCRAHGLKFDVTTGFVSGVPDFGVTSYAVRVAAPAGSLVRLSALDVPRGWIASFCTPHVCSPFRVTFRLRGGTGAIQLSYVRSGERAQPLRRPHVSGVVL